MGMMRDFFSSSKYPAIIRAERLEKLREAEVMKSRRGELGMLLKSPTNKTGARVSFEPFVPAYSDHNMSPNTVTERERFFLIWRYIEVLCPLY